MNSPGRFEHSITINRAPSPRLVFSMAVVCLCIFLSVMVLGLAVDILFLLLLPAIPLFVRKIGEHALLSTGDSIVRIQSHDGKHWCLHRKCGRQSDAVLAGCTYLSSYLLVLVFSAPQNRSGIPVILLPDAVGNDSYRRLLVLLRTGKATIDK